MKNTTTIEKTQKMTERGQITLPISWRKKVKTDTIHLRTDGDSIEISPVYKEYTVFDAIRDNKGKGLKASDLVKTLKKIDKN
ncbi:MAG: AbrB/MazE/SpoVT family DNA-binding domain-containing protein [Patescibacteria group bacterium]